MASGTDATRIIHQSAACPPKVEDVPFVASPPQPPTATVTALSPRIVRQVFLYGTRQYSRYLQFLTNKVH